jgi:hypothetical protein
MQQIGAALILVGLMGVPVLGLMGAGVSTMSCVLLWAALGFGVFWFEVWKHRGIRPWLAAPIATEFTVPPVVMLCVGLIFAAAGLGILLFGKPSNGPKAMNREQMILFGSIFLLIGVGVSLLSNARRPDSRSPSGDARRMDRNR